jgi:ribosome biogenesis GTPase
LVPFGWDEHFESRFTALGNDAWVPARVIGNRRVVVASENTAAGGANSGPSPSSTPSESLELRFGEELLADIPGRLRYEAESALEMPSVGDWVAITPRLREGRATIEKVIERKSSLVRRAAGERDDAQVIAANVDTTFIVSSMNQDLNERRLERYLALVRSGGSRPVILLSKADLATDHEAKLTAVHAITQGAPVVACSTKTGEGFDALNGYLKLGQTIAVIGSSGVGKSTLVNRLLGHEAMKTQAIREDDDKGRHTTTARYLLPLPSGAMIIDTPGMREIQLWDAEEGVGETFEDIEEIALRCKFTNCRHENEKGCAVRTALQSGEITEERLTSFKKLQAELASRARRR